MRALVTGASGFVGRYLIRELRAHGHDIVGFDAVAAKEPADYPEYIGSIADAGEVLRCVREAKPDACVHLAGIAFVPMGWSHPQRVMEVNLAGTIHLLEAFARTNRDARILVVTSAEVYGREKRPEPVCESHALHASNLYAVSKMSADLSALLYHPQYGMPVMTARPQNHIGPGQSRLFVVSSFAEQLIALRQSSDAHPVLRVGNLDSRRDFTDVRDVVRAYRLLLENGQPGEAYNIASGRMVPIRDMLEQFFTHAGITPAVEIDPALYRPTDRPPQLSIEKIASPVGWTPAIPLAQSLKDIYDDLAEHPDP